MVRKLISKQSKSLDLPGCIENHLAELKSFGLQVSNKKELGKSIENWVSLDRQEKYQETLFAKNLKTRFAEIDLVMRRRDGSFVILEVKFGKQGWPATDLISSKQKMRIERAAEFLRLNQDFELFLAHVVCKGGKLEVEYLPWA